jgi:uncharacterized protein YjbJ (UPF0337 family)
MSDDSSTLKSYVDSATGMVQQGIASLTGSTGDQVDILSPSHFLSLTNIFQANADQTKAKAHAEKDLSHAGIRAGPFSVSSTGVPAKDNADRTQGSWDQTVGSGKETLGGLIGSESLKQQGRDQNQAGQEQEAKGQLNDLGKGVSDRVTGAVGGAVASLTGDREGQAKYADQHDEGKSRQRGVEMDLSAKADAQQK